MPLVVTCRQLIAHPVFRIEDQALDLAENNQEHRMDLFDFFLRLLSRCHVPSYQVAMMCYRLLRCAKSTTIVHGLCSTLEALEKVLTARRVA